MSALKKILIVGGILLLPCVFYLLLIRGENRYKRLEIFGPREPVAGAVAGGTDTLYHTIADFTLTGEDGRELKGSDFRGKITVVDFFFATCQTICPKMSTQLQRVQDKFRDDPDVVILSYSVNPDRDTAEALLAYAQKYQAIHGKWHFATGDKKQIYDLARRSFFLSVADGNGGPDDFIHSDQLVLIDKEGRIRGYYDGTDPAEANRLMDEIIVLKMEYQPAENRKGPA